MNTNHVFSAFSFISFVLVSIPFIWHLEAWNTATCLYMFWMSLSNFAFFVNSIVWDGNVVDWAPVWCDITSRLILAVNIAIPATCLCIQRRLYYVVLNPAAVTMSQVEKRRLIMVDMMIGFGLPILNITLTYFVQPKRYMIIEDFGCHPEVVNNILGVLLVPTWPIVISLISGVYGCLNIYHVWAKRRTIRSMQGSSTGSIKFSRYLRLFMLSGMDLLFTIPVSAWVFSSWFPVYQWQGWTALHSNISQVETLPASIWRSDHNDAIAVEATRWFSVGFAFLFFFFFGFAEEARKHYAFAFYSVAKKVGYHTGSSGSTVLLASDQYNLQPMNSMRSHDVVLDISHRNECLDSGKSNPFGSSGGESRSTIAPVTHFDPDSKRGFELESTLLSDMKNLVSDTPQSDIPNPPSPRSSDLELTKTSVTTCAKDV